MFLIHRSLHSGTGLQGFIVPWFTGPVYSGFHDPAEKEDNFFFFDPVAPLRSSSAPFTLSEAEPLPVRHMYLFICLHLRRGTWARGAQAGSWGSPTPSLLKGDDISPGV